MLLRVETKTDELLVHGKSGQNLSGRGMHDFRCQAGYRAWFAGQVERGALHLPTKAQLRRCEPGLDLDGYDNPEGEEGSRGSRDTSRESDTDTGPARLGTRDPRPVTNGDPRPRGRR